MTVFKKDKNIRIVGAGFMNGNIPDDILRSVSPLLPSFTDASYIVFPGFCDVHVHFREPGFSYKETITTGSRAAAHGGYTAVLAMPNLSPVPDSAENLGIEQKIIERDACIKVYPYAAITVGQKGEKLVPLEELAEKAIAFSDDGHGVQSENLMREAMMRVKALDKIIVAHCEDNSLLKGGYIHDGSYARTHGHRGICSESEWRPIERDLRLAKETGCPYHVCHISCKESVELIRQAKKEGVDVTCETAPHYLLLDENDLREEGRFRMNPPLRSKEDREALVNGVLDGTIDMIATDHAPHTEEEKAKGLAGSPFGIVGIETAFPLLWTEFVEKGIFSPEKLCELLAVNPRKRFNIPMGCDYTVFRTGIEVKIDPNDFLSMGKSTPFTDRIVTADCVLTVSDGKIVYRKN